MEMTSIAELIGNYVFPIAACIYLAIDAREQRKTHSEEMSRITGVLNDNTVAITRLTDHLEAILHEDF